MYAETGLMFPYFQNLSSSDFDDFCDSQKFDMDNLIQTSSTISDYDLGGEGDLFKAPEPIIDQQPLVSMTSIIPCEEDLKVIDVESLQNQDFLNDVFYECNSLLLSKESSSPLTGEVLSFSFPVKTNENFNVLDPSSCQIPKGISSDSLNTMDWIQGVQLKSNLLNFNEIDFGMRRAFSEGDIKTLSDGKRSLGYYPVGQVSECITEDRMQKLSRYRNKKTKRNFGRKIKYACRKVLADSQPRIRGRFAKTDESDIMRK